MADKSLIEWTDTTWQIVTGCSVVSPGCTNCYAMRLAGGRMQNHPSGTMSTQRSCRSSQKILITKSMRKCGKPI